MRYTPTLVVVAVAVTSACSQSAANELPAASHERIDEVGGTYGGVGIGDPREDVWRVFGRQPPLGRDEGFQPTGAGDDSYGPNYIPAETGYAYEDVLFWFPVEDIHLGRGSPLRGRQDEVAGFQVTARGAPTLRGIEARRHAGRGAGGVP